MKRFLLAFALILIVACGGLPTPTNPGVELTRNWGDVEEITLSDGTVCAVARSGQGIGIDCDWRTG